MAPQASPRPRPFPGYPQNGYLIDWASEMFAAEDRSEILVLYAQLFRTVFALAVSSNRFHDELI